MAIQCDLKKQNGLPHRLRRFAMTYAWIIFYKRRPVGVYEFLGNDLLKVLFPAGVACF